MSLHEQHNKNKAVMENNTARITKSSSMKHEWFPTINNTVYYYQTPFNVALILEQPSNYNVVLREKMEMKKSTFMKQNNVFSDVNSLVSKLCTTSNKHSPKGLEEKSE